MDNSSTPTHNIDPTLTHEAITALKWRISVLEQENTQLTSKVFRTPYVDPLPLLIRVMHLIITANSIHSWVREGRAIRHLVSLKDPMVDLVAEYDRCLLLAEDNNQVLEAIESSAE